MRRMLLCVLALVVGAGPPAADAVAKSGGGGAKHRSHSAQPKKKKKKKKASSKQARGAKGDKGDKGDRGDAGAKGDKGDTGSAVVDRARLAAPTSTGDDDDGVDLPLTGASWVAAPDESDDWAGMVTFAAPPACDPPTDPLAPLFGENGEPGYGVVSIELDDDLIGDAFVDWQESKAGKNVSVPIRFYAGRTLNGDAPTTHTLKAHASDGCGSSGQSFTIADLRINVYGTR